MDMNELLEMIEEAKDAQNEDRWDGDPGDDAE